MIITRNRLLLTIASATTVLLAASVASTVRADPTLLDSVKQRGTLRIALEGTFPPFNYQDVGGNLAGFKIAGLDTGRYDVVLNQVTISLERQQRGSAANLFTPAAFPQLRKRETSC